ncbi:MAG: CYTH domain-containing protein [Chthoniobacterales bacterium]
MNPAANQGREIERRFLIEEFPNLKPFEKLKVTQGYITDPPTVVRLRSAGKNYFLTIKRGRQADHEEREITLTKTQFDALWPMTSDRHISKTRYLIPYGELTIELDFFHGRHEGLKIAEVEFSSHLAMVAFKAPPWFGKEITDDIRYANVSLACPTNIIYSQAKFMDAGHDRR